MAVLSERGALAGDGRGPDGRRGQLLFVTAIGLAVLLVVLSATLNATVDTGGVGPDGTATDGSSNALRFQADATAAIGSAMDHVNRGAEDSYSDLEAALDERVAAWSDLAVRHTARDGTWVRATVVDTTDGTRLAQTDAARALTDVDGNETWTVVSDADRVRAVHLAPSNESLVEVTTPSPTASVLENEDVFTVTLHGDGQSARVFVYRTDDDPAVVSVDSGDGSLDGSCAAPVGPDGRFGIDLTGATVSNTDCEPLEAFADLDGPYTVAFDDGDNAVGTYSLVVDRRPSEVDTDGYHGDGDADGPTATKAIYDSTVETTYASRTIDATLEHRIAPGEFDD
ncbi:MAG: hypothetical protein ACQEQY_03485 [Halobacteriota archaeon]